MSGDAGTAILLFVIATIMLYGWIIWKAKANGRSALVWVILSFFITPWVVLILLGIVGESDTKTELRELKKQASPADTDFAETEEESDKHKRFIWGIVTIALFALSIVLFIK